MPIVETITKIGNTVDRLYVDFTQPELCKQTIPIKAVIGGVEIPLTDRQSWSELMALITNVFIEQKNPALAELAHMPLCKTKTAKRRLVSFFKGHNERPFLMRSPLNGQTCARLSNGKYINVNFNAPNIVRLIGLVCVRCGVELKDVIIEYLPKSIGVTGLPTQNNQPQQCESAWVDKDGNITYTLMEHFSNGFRLNSTIELSRFRRFAANDHRDELPLSDEELTAAICSVGTFCEGKVYVVSAETKKRIKETLDCELGSGAEVIFYEEFYSKNEDWLFDSGVVSINMLKEILRSQYPQLHFRDSYFGKRTDAIMSVITSEVLRVWNDDVLLSYSQLADRIPYIPLERIKQTLGQNGDFIWSENGTYTHISKIHISVEERRVITDSVEKRCSANRYVSLSDLPLDKVIEDNCELSLTAIHTAVFAVCLADKYSRKGKIITPLGSSVDAFTIMKAYCRSLDRCSLDNLLSFEKELTGECHRWIPMEAGYAIMVRISATEFMAENFFVFDVASIDNAIEEFVRGREYLPLKEVTTFSTFPHCGQAWNLFLLESYCRRFSAEFRFEALSVNNKNSGAIARKYSRLTYADIMADAVAKSGLGLEKKTVLNFLFEQGYIGKRNYSKTEDVIKQAKVIRESRD